MPVSIYRSYIITVAIAFASLLSTHTAHANTDLKRSINSAINTFKISFARSDAAALAAIYTNNAQLLPPNSAIIFGSNNIQHFWQQGEYATEIGSYHIQGEAGKTLDKGKYMILWKKENGQWKYHRDILNSNQKAG